MGVTALNKSQYIPFLDTKNDKTFSSNTWKRIDKSTIFALTAGEQSESVDYICDENATEEITGNAPELPQEIRIEEGSPIYDFMFEMLYNLPTGEDCKVPYLLCFGGSSKKAWRGICTITSKVLDTVARKITFTMKIGGNIERGTYSILDGSPTFSPAEA